MIEFGDIDLVYLWCDLADERFRAKRAALLSRLGASVEMRDNGACRYASNDELRYSLRSVDLHLPWIRKIHLVVDDDISLPTWLNVDHPKLHVVRWGEVMPSHLLPCFNSTTFEFFLGDIPGLAERFLYSNDDTFVGRDLEPSFFFAADGYPFFRYTKSQIDMTGLPPDDGYLRIVWNSYRFIQERVGVSTGYRNAYGHLSHHCIDAYCRSDLQAFCRTFKREVEETVRFPFRDMSQIHREVFAGYAFSQQHAHFRTVRCPWYVSLWGGPHRESWCTSSANPNIFQDFRRIKPSLFCLNDSAIVKDVDHVRVHSFLEELFPRASTFEVT